MKRSRRRPPGPFEAERAEIDEFVRCQVSTADAFVTVVELGGREVTAGSLQVAEFLRGLRFWERRGCVRLLLETEREYLGRCGPVCRGRIVEEVERKFDAYYDALDKGGYL